MIVSMGANAAQAFRARDALPTPASAGRWFARREHLVAGATNMVAGA